MAKAKKPKHIAVAGNIGAGKTTLTEMLSKHYKWIPQFEDVERNPYLMDFYEDMPRWSFNLQIYFLNSRLNQLVDIRSEEHTSELQSQSNLVCRLLLEKKKIKNNITY